MGSRKIPLVTGGVYHIFSKSIAEFEIFRENKEFSRMKSVIWYYTIKNPPLQFSTFIEIKDKENFSLRHLNPEERLVEIIAYCIMPTHLHLVLKQIKENGISIFMSNILNSYTRYFNIKTKRKGPLWESRFKNVEVNAEEQLLHLTRYIHLNPVTAHLIDKPQDWQHSSLNEFLGKIARKECICNYHELLEIRPEGYDEFVNSQIDYQRELAEIKNIFLE